MGFVPTWRKWISKCISKPSISIIINGSIIFQANRGLRQGDPLSIGELFSQAISCHYDSRSLTGFQTSHLGPIITQLLYADDTLIFYDVNPSQVNCLWRFQRTFELLTGMKVKLSKTKMMGIHVEVSILQRLASCLGCTTHTIPSSYFFLDKSVAEKAPTLFLLIKEQRKTIKIQPYATKENHVGQPYREIHMEIRLLERQISIIWGKNHLNSSNSSQYSHLFHVTFPYPHFGHSETGKTHERLPLVRGGRYQENSPSGQGPSMSS
ncbi:hypothetical protein AMTRI_Chr09g36820 [Amborella trichopoda]